MSYQPISTTTLTGYHPHTVNAVRPSDPSPSTVAPTDAQASICEALKGFSPISLEELDSLKLQNRIDTKYLIPVNLLPAILRSLQTSCQVMTIANQRFFTYENEYLDTANFDFFRLHHNGKANRYKIRLRHYVETDSRFLEIKFKTNHDRTIKYRIPVGEDATDPKLHATFLCSHFDQSTVDHLLPTQYSRYNRITLANAATHERITFDFNLTYLFNNQTNRVDHCTELQTLALDHLCIAEIKHENSNHLSCFKDLMRRYAIHPSSFSKYCIGCCLLYPDRLRQNAFKPVLRRISKLRHVNGGSICV